MFAIVIERDPLRWQEIPGYMASWLHVVGALSAAALLVWFIIRIFRTSRVQLLRSPGEIALFRLAVGGAIVALGLYVVLRSPEIIAAASAWLGGDSYQAAALGPPEWRGYCLDIACACALLAAALPLISDLAGRRLSPRRIWALARLSFKEAIRRKILWAFTSFLVILLFAIWFIPGKEEDQVRNYVTLVSKVMMVLVLFTAGALASFSIPSDVRAQTIHTIVTKPVEKFEIVLGRFLGFTMLMTLILGVMTGISLLYVVRTTTGYSPFSYLLPDITPEAQFESLRARVPVYGKLEFRGKEARFKGVNVGREFDYRQYIAGGAGSPHRMVWSFQELPADLANRAELTVPCEFSLDIFRTLKGEEGKGVFATFVFQSRNFNPALKPQYDLEREQERNKPDANPDEYNNRLAEKFGYYEVPNKEIQDYHTQAITVPTGLFKNALAEPSHPAAEKSGEGPTLLQVAVKCESGGQFLGAARYDLYILARERSFVWNFVKGAAGLWLQLCIVLALTVTCSTYLSGVISFVVAAFVYVSGIFLDYVRSLAENTAVGGGPFEQLVRLVQREPLSTTLEATPGVNLAQGTDNAYRFILNVVVNFLPDVNRFDWWDYVGQGFDIAMVNMLALNALFVVGYLLPWALAAYYLIKTREIATW
jgi:ABC-type transport system involved in multi-copper enzyme maturation permease subunit